MEKESIKILKECIILQEKKSNDYQNPNSRIKQADYYPRGIHTITDICWAKMLRIYSVLEAMDYDNNYSPNYESLEDSFKDLINYSSFAVSWIRCKINGQIEKKDNYTLLGSFKNEELPIVLKYLIEKNHKFKIINSEVYIDISIIGTEGLKFLSRNLIISLNKC